MGKEKAQTVKKLFTVLVTENARADLGEIYSGVLDSDSRERADYVLEQLRKVISTLNQLPNRGSVVKELGAIGFKEYRQVLFKPYRIIYIVEQQSVEVLLIADGRRDMRTLLAIRMLGTD